MSRLRLWLFAFFAVSGFCSLVYQVVWLRLTMAAFGVNTAMVSIVLSVFMGGLALGSWVAGRLVGRRTGGPTLPLRLYGLAELAISASAAVVPPCLDLGRRLLGEAIAASWSSPLYFLVAGGWVALVLVPFTLAMGATIPFAMSALRTEAGAESQRSFSLLYLANVVGATTGTLVSAYVLIELLGFRGTLHLVAGLNATLAAAALALSLGERQPRLAEPEPEPEPERPAGVGGEGWIGGALFLTGFASLAMEVMWVRQFTPYLGTVVYAFATILAVYLAATTVGSLVYRRRRASGREAVVTGPWVWPIVAGAALLPALAADPRLGADASLAGLVRVVLGVGPYCALLGYVTPSLVDRRSQGDPAIAGRAYALNVAGSILGPLAAAWVLLPRLSEPWALAVLAIPLGLLSLAAGRSGVERLPRALLGPALSTLACLALAAGARTFETLIEGARVLRDETATVTASGDGMQKRLLVNGVGMTYLTPITKMMAHLPLAFLDHPPRGGLILCFGMGTSFRSMRSWDIPVTAVELVPSVPKLFGFYHPDGPQLLRDPGSRVVVDDARRFLEWSPGSFDVIAVDPPPPIEASGSSLLYSVEFYQAARRRLSAGGILQQWIPGGDTATVGSMASALHVSFPHTRFFHSIEGWGVHVLASERPIPARDGAVLAARLPEAAGRDLVEWGPETAPSAMFEGVLRREIPAARIVPGRRLPPLRDDRPINEYYFLRRLGL